MGLVLNAARLGLESERDAEEATTCGSAALNVNDAETAAGSQKRQGAGQEDE